MWYADDASATGSLISIRTWWDELTSVGPDFGYFANASKTWLVKKPEYLKKAREIFDTTNVNITSHGRPYLGAPLGSSEFTEQFIREKVNNWVCDLRLLSDIAKAQPHACYAAFIHGFVHKFSYLCRTNSNMNSLLEPLEECISSRRQADGTAPPLFDTRTVLTFPIAITSTTDHHFLTSPTSLKNSHCVFFHPPQLYCNSRLLTQSVSDVQQCTNSCMLGSRTALSTRMYVPRLIYTRSRMRLPQRPALH